MGFPIDDVRCFKKGSCTSQSASAKRCPILPRTRPMRDGPPAILGVFRCQVTRCWQMEGQKHGGWDTWRWCCDLFAVLGRLVEICMILSVMDCGWHHVDSSWPRTLRTAWLSGSGFGCRDTISAPQGTLHCFEGRPGLGGRPDHHETGRHGPFPWVTWEELAWIFLDMWYWVIQIHHDSLKISYES